MHIKRPVNHDIMKIIEAAGYGVGVVEGELGECDDPRWFFDPTRAVPQQLYEGISIFTTCNIMVGLATW